MKHFSAECRPRTEVEPEPFWDGITQGDVDAMKLALKLSNEILQEAGGNDPKRRRTPFGEFMTNDQIGGMTLLNHIMVYLEHPRKYEEEIRPKLYGYIRVS